MACKFMINMIEILSKTSIILLGAALTAAYIFILWIASGKGKSKCCAICKNLKVNNKDENYPKFYCREKQFLETQNKESMLEEIECKYYKEQE